MNSALVLTLPSKPVVRSSSTRTEAPRLPSASTGCEPMNPAPPVTSACTDRHGSGRVAGFCGGRPVHFPAGTGASAPAGGLDIRRTRRAPVDSELEFEWAEDGHGLPEEW